MSTEPEPFAAAPRVIYQGPKFDLALQPVRLADGSLAEREVVLHPGSVVLLPLLEGDRVVLIRNHRPALGRTLLELPAGTLGREEEPEACAARELREETGYRSRSIRRLTDWLVGPGVTTERMYAFVCEELTEGEQALELDERIEPVVIPWAEALAMALDGRIDDAKTRLFLLLWELHRTTASSS